MNERIRELAAQADLITHKVPNGLAHLHTEQDIYKFAELLIKECANIARQVESDNSDDYKSGRNND